MQNNNLPESFIQLIALSHEISNFVGRLAFRRRHEYRTIFRSSVSVVSLSVLNGETLRLRERRAGVIARVRIDAIQNQRALQDHFNCATLFHASVIATSQ